MGKPDKYSVRNCKTADDFVRAVKHQGGSIENGGKHQMAVSPDGSDKYPLPHYGNAQLDKGTQHGIAKGLIALGFICLGGCFLVAIASSGNDSSTALAAFDAIVATATATATPLPPGTMTGCLGPASIGAVVIGWILLH